MPFFGRGLIGGLWLAFIGWFLAAAAGQTWKLQLAHEMLEGLTVSRLMRPVGMAIPPEICEIVGGPVSAEVVATDSVMKQLVKHPLTDVGLAKFLADARKAAG